MTLERRMIRGRGSFCLDLRFSGWRSCLRLFDTGNLAYSLNIKLAQVSQVLAGLFYQREQFARMRFSLHQNNTTSLSISKPLRGVIHSLFI